MSFDASHLLRRLDLGPLELPLALESPGNPFDLGAVTEMAFDEVCSTADRRRASKGSTASCPITRSLLLEDALFTVLIGVLLLFLVVFEVTLEAVYSFNCFASTGVTPDCSIRQKHVRTRSHFQTRNKYDKFTCKNMNGGNDTK